MKSFLDFIREQGVVGLVIGFILGASVSKLVNSLVEDIINPILGIFLGKTQTLTSYVLTVKDVEIYIGNFLSVFIDFIVITLVVFIVFKKLGLEKLDRKKDPSVLKRSK